jgi:hypothetical protein
VRFDIRPSAEHGIIASFPGLGGDIHPDPDDCSRQRDPIRNMSYIHVTEYVGGVTPLDIDMLNH